jgi:hypothetical protein
MDRHRGGTQDHHEIDGNFIERWHCRNRRTGLKMFL